MNKRIFILTLLFIACLRGLSHGQAGQLDSMFGVNGKIIYSTKAGNYLVLPNDKILNISYVENDNVGYITLYRYQVDGTIDSSFGIDGVNTLPYPINNYGSTAQGTLLPDGKILLWGALYEPGNNEFLFARCDSNGYLDSTFGTNGYTYVDMPGDLGWVSGISLLNDQSILAVGRCGTSSSVLYPGFVKLTQNGIIDSSFGSNGQYLVTNLGYSGTFNKLLRQSNGKFITIILGNNGTNSNLMAIARINEDGTFDNSFGNNGIVNVTFDNSSSINDITLQSDDKIIGAGDVNYTSNPPASKLGFFRLNADGTLDNTFGNNGIAYENSLYNAVSPFLSIQNVNNEILVAYSSKTSVSNVIDFTVSRLNTNGILDNGFGNDGISRFDMGSSNEGPNFIALQYGRILVAGYSGNNSLCALARLNSCGITVSSDPSSITKEVNQSATFSIVTSPVADSFQWQRLDNGTWTDISNGGQYSGAQSATLNVATLTMDNDQQQYRCIAVSGACSDTSAPAILTVQPATGVPDIANAKGLSLFPNPVNDRLTISTTANLGLRSVDIHNILGQEIAHYSANGQRMDISTSALASGTYFVKINLENGHSYMAKVTKQ